MAIFGKPRPAFTAAGLALLGGGSPTDVFAAARWGQSIAKQQNQANQLNQMGAALASVGAAGMPVAMPGAAQLSQMGEIGSKRARRDFLFGALGLLRGNNSAPPVAPLQLMDLRNLLGVQQPRGLLDDFIQPKGWGL